MRTKYPYSQPSGINPFMPEKRARRAALCVSVIAAGLLGLCTFLSASFTNCLMRVAAMVASSFLPPTPLVIELPTWLVWGVTTCVVVEMVPLCYIGYMRDYRRSKASVAVYVASILKR